MIIKEYRLVMPMTVEEYQIGQLYTIQKKSRLESEGAGSGVEIIKNEPYVDGNEHGQYTLKIYHVDQRMPPHLKTIVGLIFPKSALLFEEEGWNRYPYTRTKYRHQLFKSFSIEIETQFLPDLGESENVFNLSKSELSNRVVEYVDIVNDNVPPNDYKEAEDPKKFKSMKTNRGPLSTSWIDELKQKRNENGGKINYMCAYKLCRVECSIWGFQSRIEKGICDSVLRSMLLITHRQAWCWQDEYVDLTIEEVRKLEAETQEILNEKMRAHTKTSNKTNNAIKQDNRKTSITTSENPCSSNKSVASVDDIIMVCGGADKNIKTDKGDNKNSSHEIKTETHNAHKHHKTSKIEEYDRADTCSSLSEREDDDYGDSVSMNSDEFFDCRSISSDFRNGDNTKLNGFDDFNKVTVSAVGSSFRNTIHEEDEKNMETNNGDLSSLTHSNPTISVDGSPIKTKFNKQLSFNLHTKSNLNQNTVDLLILVVHGGNVMSITNSVSNDFSNLKTTFDKVIKSYYTHAEGRIEYRLVTCEDLCRDTLLELSALSAINQNHNLTNTEISSAPIPFHLYETLPYHVLPLFAISKTKEYSEKLSKLIKDCNRTYQEFSSSNENFGFNGQVIIIGDSMGSLLAFDAISTAQTNYALTPSYQSSQVQTNSSPQTPTTPSLHLPNPSNIYTSQKSCPAYVNIPNSNNQSTPKFDIGNDFFGSDSSSKTSSTLSFISERLEFNVSHFFSLGSLLGLILAFRKHTNSSFTIPEKLGCRQMYNLFHLNDPLAIRIEPLLCKEFSSIDPCTISPFSMHPFGDGTPFLLDSYLIKNRQLFEKNKPFDGDHSKIDNLDLLKNISKIWWGTDRIDYVLHSPEHLRNLPKQSLPYVFHGCFWESTDVAAFILRTVMKVNDSKFNRNRITTSSIKRDSKEKWINRSNRVKLRNLAPNHRANDVIVLENQEQILTAKFSYGPLDFALSGEKVDIYASINKEWKLYATETTDSHGRVKFKIPNEQRLPQGMHTILMNVKCDNSLVEFHMCVLPPKTETVVFSIDGSFAANISLSGTDPKVRAGAVDIVRYWQDLGYLIIYITARPDIQQAKVLNWLAQHNFPKGMVFFSDGISAVPFRQKAENLRNLVNENKLILRAGYGSTKDIPMYQSLNLDHDNIFIVGKNNKKKYSDKAVILTGYSAHLNDLKAKTRCANGNTRLIIKKTSFTLKNLYQSFNDITLSNNYDTIFNRQDSSKYHTIHCVNNSSANSASLLISNK